MRHSVAYLIGALSSAFATDYTYCGTDHLNVGSVDVDPVPVEPGEPLYVSFSGVPEKDITGEGVSIKVSVSLFGIVIAHEHFDMCTDLQLTCPLKAGEPFTGILTYPTPSDAPPGMKVKARVDVREADATLTCVEVELKVAKDEEVEISALEERQLTPEEPRDAFEAELMADLEREEDYVLRQELIDAVNSHPTAAWRAHRTPRFHAVTHARAKKMVAGTVLRGEPGYFELPLKPTGAADTWASLSGGLRIAKAAEVPAAFDAREQWPECASVIGHISDQSDCGSCWAFASTEAFNDRYCIATGAKDTTLLSAEDTLACCRGLLCGLSMGCNGGQPGAAWAWFHRKGVVSGGDYSSLGDGATCLPYAFQPCAHHTEPTADIPACPASEYPSPKCVKSCSDASYGVPYEQDKRFAATAYRLRSVEDIQEDLMAHGSVTAAFTVYEDFLAYAGGVYEHVSGSPLGGHAVKILGWGKDKESGKDYWLVANSWNESWGENGMFRIIRGVNEAGIEGQVVAGEV